MSNVYYKVFRDNDRKLCILTLQDFDEKDCSHFRFVTDQKFGDLRSALAWLDDYEKRTYRQHGLRKSELKKLL